MSKKEETNWKEYYRLLVEVEKVLNKVIRNDIEKYPNFRIVVFVHNCPVKMYVDVVVINETQRTRRSFQSETGGLKPNNVDLKQMGTMITGLSHKIPKEYRFSKAYVYKNGMVRYFLNCRNRPMKEEIKNVRN